MAVSQADIDNLEAALMSGELVVKYDGREITYRSVEQLERALNYARSQVTAPSSVILAEFCRD